MEAYSLLMLLAAILGVVLWSQIDGRRCRRETDEETFGNAAPQAAKPGRST